MNILLSFLIIKKDYFLFYFCQNLEVFSQELSISLLTQSLFYFLKRLFNFSYEFSISLQNQLFLKKNCLIFVGLYVLIII
jgi:hypothetical protein